MVKYIECETVVRIVCEDCNRVFPEEPCEPSDCTIMQMLRSIPAADVRPVVLCRDCDCWNDWDSAGKESLGNYVCSCAHWSVEDGPVLYTRPTDFCSYGEKREESRWLR
jgi:hypothetical protein